MPDHKATFSITPDRRPGGVSGAIIRIQPAMRSWSVRHRRHRDYVLILNGEVMPDGLGSETE